MFQLSQLTSGQKNQLIYWAILAVIFIGVLDLLIWANADFIKNYPISKSEENIIQNETADWQVYKNTEYGFEIKIPKDWVKLTDIQKDNLQLGNGIHFILPETINEREKAVQNSKDRDIGPLIFPELSIFAIPVPPKLILGELGFDINKFRFVDSDADSSQFKENIVFGDQIETAINGNRALIYTAPYSPRVVRILVGDNLYDFYMGSYNGPKDFSDKNNLYNKILNTFKVNSTELTNWRIYKNTEYGFEIKIPEDFFIKIGTNYRFNELIAQPTIQITSKLYELDGRNYEIVIGNNPSKLTPRQFVENIKNTPTDGPSFIFSNIQDIIINNIQGASAELNGEGGRAMAYYFSNKNKDIIIMIWWGIDYIQGEKMDRQTFQKYLDNGEKLVGSFKLTN